MTETETTLLKACEWALEQFTILADNGKYPEHMLQENGGDGFMPLVEAINKAKCNKIPNDITYDMITNGFEFNLCGVDVVVTLDYEKIDSNLKLVQLFRISEPSDSSGVYPKEDIHNYINNK